MLFGEKRKLLTINFHKLSRNSWCALDQEKVKQERQILILCLKRQLCRRNKMTKKQKGCRQMDSLSENLLKPSQANLHRQQWGVFYDLWKDIIAVTSNCIIMGSSIIYIFGGNLFSRELIFREKWLILSSFQFLLNHFRDYIRT